MPEQSTLRELYVPVENIEINEDVMTARLPDGEMLTTNFSMIKQKQIKVLKHPKFFLMDKNDVECAEKKIKNGETETLENFGKFMKTSKNKRVYLRYFPHIINCQESRRFLMEEVMEIIPVLKQHQCLLTGDVGLESSRESLANLQKGLVTNAHGMLDTIDMNRLEEMLDEYGIDKSLITIVNDLAYELSAREMLERNTAAITFFHSTGEEVMFSSQAALFVFQSVVCGIDWRVEMCKTHECCTRNMKIKIWAILQRLAAMKPEELMTKYQVENIVAEKMNHCTYVGHMARPGQTRQFLLQRMTFISDIPMKTYSEICDFYGLPDMSQCLQNPSESEINVSNARVLFILGWIYSFFGPTFESAVGHLMDAIVTKVPRDSWKFAYLLLKNAIEQGQIPSEFFVDHCFVALLQGKSVNIADNENKRLSAVELVEYILEEENGVVFALMNDDGVLKSNLCFIPEEDRENVENFIVDTDDVEWVQQQTKSSDGAKYSKLYTLPLKEFSKMKSKKLYIRTFIVTSKGREITRVFAEEALNILAILETENDGPSTLQQTREMWKYYESDANYTIDILQFEASLEKANINKELITTIPDLSYVTMLRNVLEIGDLSRNVLNCVGTPVMFPSHAMLSIFLTLVRGINWRIKICKEHPNCLEEFRFQILGLMEKYANVSQNTMVSKNIVDEEIAVLKTHCSFNKQMRPAQGSEDYKLQDKDVEDTIQAGDYTNICDRFGLPDMRGFKPRQKANQLQIHVVRIYLLVGWMECFFDTKMEHMKNTLIDGLIHTVPDDAWNAFHHFLNQFITDTNMKNVSFNPQQETEDYYQENSDAKSRIAKMAQDAERRNKLLKQKKQKKNTTHPPVNSSNSMSSIQGEGSLAGTTRPKQFPSDKVKNDTEKLEPEPVQHEPTLPEEAEESSKGEKQNDATLSSEEQKEFCACGLNDSQDTDSEIVVLDKKNLKRKMNQMPKNKRLKKLNGLACKNCHQANQQAGQYEKKAKRTDELEKELEKLNNDMKELKRKKEKADHYRMEEKTLREEAEKNATENAEKAKITEELEEKLKGKNATLDEKNKEIEKLTKKLASQPDLQTKIGELEANRIKRDSVVKKLKESNANLENEAQDLKKQLNQKTRQAEEDQRKFANNYDKIRNEMAKMLKINEELTSKIRALEVDNSQHKATLEENAMVVSGMLNRNETLAAEKSQLTEQVKSLKHELKVFRNSDPSTSDNGTLDSDPDSDDECLLCCRNMLTMECDLCKTVYHKKCLAKWFEQKIANSRCPACRNHMVNKEQFPELKQ